VNSRLIGAAICILALLVLLAVLPATRAVKTAAGQDARKSLDAFNAAFSNACLKMDHPASAALWADDGTDLIQGMEPMIGKAKIADWLNSLTPQLKGAKMIYCTVDWKDIQIHGDLAYEWGINKQKIEFPPPQEPFVGAGKILLILKRQPSGDWKLALESWNSLPEPEAAKQ
jgi:ketosteroid isomerase-like protein